ncbi:MAG TPA: hypothetical protein VGV61_10230 [Thermoanaerobaculia bacterium]|nr:hypothetical protein [Thermoanaerobaculia bacterium]
MLSVVAPRLAAGAAVVHRRWRPLAELGDEAGAALCSVTDAGGERWLLFALPAEALAADAAQRAASLVSLRHEERHLALPRVWRPARGGGEEGPAEPAALALPSPGAVRASALLPRPGNLSAPELLCRLLLAEALAGLAAAHRLGLWHGLLTPASLLLAGAPPARLIADCPRDPRVVVVGCGVLALASPAVQAAAVAAAAMGDWLAPELRRDGRLGPAADLWALGAIGRALLAGSPSPLVPLLDRLQATRPEQRPDAAAAAQEAREQALAGLAAWRRSPAGAPAPASTGAGVVDTPPPRPPVARAAALTGSASLARVGPLLSFAGPAPLPSFPNPSTGLALWLSIAPSAAAGLLTLLLALALLLAATP